MRAPRTSVGFEPCVSRVRVAALAADNVIGAIERDCRAIAQRDGTAARHDPDRLRIEHGRIKHIADEFSATSCGFRPTSMRLTTLAGTKLGRYEVLKCLAHGATTDLLLARARGMAGFERHVVIKRIQDQHAEDPVFVQAFMTEARLAAALHHHNIVQVQDIGEDGGAPYFAMEYVHGEDVRTILAHVNKRRERLPLEYVISIVTSVAAALHHAHERSTPDGKPLSIVHRDVTPANIIVSYDGNVKVVDFGIAKATITMTTQVGVLKGRSPYMAPEQCAAKPVDRRSDVFALGIVLWEMATMRSRARPITRS
jgi:serine/threonine protein kinase